MADSLDRYGSMGRPERKGRVHVRRNPVYHILSSYEVFRRTADEIIKEDRNWPNSEETVPVLYAEACRCLEGARGLKADGKKVLDALRTFARDYDGTGIFLSAVLNETGMRELVMHDFPELETIGYHLKPSKLVAIGKGVYGTVIGKDAKGRVAVWGDSNFLGEYGKGCFILNFGDAESIAGEASGGVYANFGSIHLETSTMAGDAAGGFYGNWGSATHLAEGCKGGVVANFNDTAWFANAAEGGVQINFHEIGEMGKNAKGVQINAGAIDSEGFEPEFAESVFDVRYNREVRELARTFRAKAAPLKAFGNLKRQGPTEKSLERIRSFDYKGFEKEMLLLAEEMAKVVRREYGKL